MGKSSSGKDSIYQLLCRNVALGLREIVPYTTRPIRSGETEGKEYHFVSEEQAQEMADSGRIIELRAYQTVHGIWKYFTADDGQIDLGKGNYILIGTLEVYEKIRVFFGRENVEPIYIYTDDGQRLMRALTREMGQESPKYAELCRRYLADEQDFSEEKLEELEISKRFYNDTLEKLKEEIEVFIESKLER